jgi:hypothetical protein
MVMPMPCAVCHGGMGHGQATFTAECSHTFHLRCVNHNTACPICFTAWHDVPGVTPTQPLLFHDNEPLEAIVRMPAATVSRCSCTPMPPRWLPRRRRRRAPLDLVMVLDVSGSMSGPKTALLKQAMGFVIDNLGPDDRLSLVSFSCRAQRLTRLTHMSDAGRASSEHAVGSLAASGRTNIKEGLREAAKVIDGR